MPILTKNHLALKFQQNWLEKHPNDVPASSKEAGLDDSLTSLNWLHNLNIMNIGNPTPPASPQPSPDNKCDFKVNPNHILNVSYVQPPKIDPKFAIGDMAPTLPSPLDKINYKTNPYVKPPYSYATLICMAMKESKKSKITLSSIYNWITDNFMYYRLADPSWQNSIRHNLSLNKCFQKVPRRKDEPGKGGFWRINPEYSDMFVNGIIKKRRGSSLQENSVPSTPTKRAHGRDEADEPVVKVKVEKIHGAEDDILLNGDVSWDSLLNQDIMINGVKIKTEQIIDEETYGVASPVMAMSPPSSETNSDDIDDIFGCDFSSEVDDTKENQALDLTVQGIKIEPPDWWTDSMNTAALREFMASPHPPSSGLSTPIAPSPVPDHELAHPWATDKHDLDDAMAAFDIDNLFDMTNIPSPLAL